MISDVHSQSLNSKLSKVCYMRKFFEDVMSPHTISTAYFPCFHAPLS